MRYEVSLVASDSKASAKSISPGLWFASELGGRWVFGTLLESAACITVWVGNRRLRSGLDRSARTTITMGVAMLFASVLAFNG